MLEIAANIALREAEKQKIDAMEVFLQKKNRKKIEIINGCITRVTEHEHSGIAIRTIINNHMSFGTTSVSTKIEDLVELTAQNARNSLQQSMHPFIQDKRITPVENIRDDRLRDLTLEEMSDVVGEVLKQIKARSVIQKIDGYLIVEVEERLVATTEGLWKREVGTYQNAHLLTHIHGRIIDGLLASG